MKISWSLTPSLILGILCLTSINACSDGTAHTFARYYTIEASSHHIVEDEDGLKLVLEGVESFVTHGKSHFNGGTQDLGTIDMHLFADWWNHPLDDQTLPLLLDRMILEGPDEKHSLLISDPDKFTYDSDMKTLTVGVTKTTVEPQNPPLNTRIAFQGGSSLKMITSPAGAHPGVCGISPPDPVPGLEFAITRDFEEVWSDKGTGAKMSVSVYRPIPKDGFSILGHFALPNYSTPSEHGCVAVTVRQKNKEDNLISKPLAYERTWTDRKSGSHQRGSFWLAVADRDFECLGDIALASDTSEPDLAEMVCVHTDLLEPAPVGPLIWNDKGSGALMNISLEQLGYRGAEDTLGFFRSINFHYLTFKNQKPINVVDAAQ